MRQLVPPVLPWRGLRTLDAFGSGGYGAPRDGGARTHAGLDFAAAEGDLVVAPFDGLIVHIGMAYSEVGPDGRYADLGSVHLAGVGEFADLRVKLLYLRPLASAAKGTEWPQGAQIGVAQNVAAYYRTKHPGEGAMTNHIHEELRAFFDGGWRVVDPTPFLMRTEVV